MSYRFDATLSPRGAISRLTPLLALGALVTACHDAERSLAPRSDGRQFSLSATQAVNGKIAFHSTRDGDFQIYVMNPDGSGVTRVTNTAGGNVDPIWSPDGKRIAFASFRTGRSEVFAINVDGSGETQLTTDGGFPGAWSPDGTRIAFANGADEILIFHLDGSGVTRLTDNSFRDFPTAWSPNGEQILFESDRDGDEELYVMNADGSGVTRLTNSPGRDEGDRAGWSPDAARIVFSSDRDGGQLHVFVMGADGSGVTQLTSGNFVDDDPVWSPDGTRVAFHSTRDGGDEDIFVMNADGSGLTQLTFNDGVFDAVPVWTQAVPVSNDAFANATVIPALPFSDAVDITPASSEPGEPIPSCSFGSSGRTVWYAFTPSETASISASVDAPFAHVLAAYTGSAVGNLVQVGCTGAFGAKLTFVATTGTTYYFQVDGLFSQAGFLQFRLESIPPPPNDNFADAIVISALPFGATVDITSATTEAGERKGSCTIFGGSVGRTAWYAFTPAETGSLAASIVNAPTNSVVTVYSGSSLATLTEVACRTGVGSLATFRALAGTTYFFQVDFQNDLGGQLDFRLDVAPLPVATFGFFPFDPTVFDVVQLSDQSFDPAGVGFEPQVWNFGDGATGTGFNVTHRYAADGDYTVELTVTTHDGRTALASQTVHVRTHDVAITRFMTPNAASSGQTRRIVVSINSKRYAETVEVQLFRSVPGGFQQFGSLTQFVPMNPKSGTTDFAFTYTFTGDDAAIGKVTFKAVAIIVGGRDALPADNDAIAPATKLGR